MKYENVMFADQLSSNSVAVSFRQHRWSEPLLDKLSYNLLGGLDSLYHFLRT